MSHGIPIRCHTPFKHYLNFHKDYGCCGGGVCNSIWGGGSRTNITFNYKDGGFWGGFKYALGGFVGNIASGLFSGIFGGWGANSFMPIGNNIWNSWNNGWSSGYDFQAARDRMSAKEKDKSKETDKAKDKAKTDSCEDKDQAKITALDKALNALDKTPDADKAKNLYNEISKLIKTPLDDDHKDENIKNYQEKLNRLKNNYNFTCDKDGNATNATQRTPSNGNTVTGTGAVPAAGSGSVTNGTPKTGDGGDDGFATNHTLPTPIEITTVKSTLPNGVTLATSEAVKGIKNIKRAHDTGESTRDVEADSNHTGCKVSDGKYEKTNFPLYLTIKDKDKEQTFKYKCIGLVGDNAIYATPASDTNNNKYVLCIENGKLTLWQAPPLQGNNKEDKQNK